MPELILASTSSARRALMDALALPYRADAPGVDETVPPGLTAEATVALLSRRKAEAVHRRFPDAWVLGSDQVVDLDGDILGKPTDLAAARAQLRRMLGRTHRIVTGVCLLGPSGARREHVEVASLTLYA